MIATTMRDIWLWHWLPFGAVAVVLLALDVLVVHRHTIFTRS